MEVIFLVGRPGHDNKDLTKKTSDSDNVHTTYTFAKIPDIRENNCENVCGQKIWYRLSDKKFSRKFSQKQNFRKTKIFPEKFRKNEYLENKNSQRFGKFCKFSLFKYKKGIFI